MASLNLFSSINYLNEEMFMCMFTYIFYVATKTITIKKSVYKKLVSIKQENESFSDLLERLSSGVSPLNLLKQMAGSIEFNDTNALKEEIREKRSEQRDVIS